MYPSTHIHRRVPPAPHVCCCVLTLTLVSPVHSGDSWEGLRDAELLHHESDCDSGPAPSNCRRLIWQMMLKQHSYSLWGNSYSAWEKHNDTSDYYTHTPLQHTHIHHTSLITVNHTTQTDRHTHTNQYRQHTRAVSLLIQTHITYLTQYTVSHTHQQSPTAGWPKQTLTVVSPICSGGSSGGLRDAELLHHEYYSHSSPAASNCRRLIR